MPRKPTLIFSLLLAFSFLATACSRDDTSDAKQFKMASIEDMPEDVRVAPVPVQQSYQFAIANPDVLEQLPCYCGCGAIGHTSNYACYVSGEGESGAAIFDSHALGCSICVDITLDAMRLLKQDKSVAEIRNYIDQTYARYGPSNMP